MNSVPLTPCVASCTIGTKTYGWKSAPVTADAGLAEGVRSYGVWGTDVIGNTGSPTAFSVTVDNSAPTVTASTIVTSSTTGVGWVGQGGTYVVYASATDAGSPATGMSSVTASVGSITTGLTVAVAAQVHVELHRRRRHLRLQERGDRGELADRRRCRRRTP